MLFVCNWVRSSMACLVTVKKIVRQGVGMAWDMACVVVWVRICYD